MKRTEKRENGVRMIEREEKICEDSESKRGDERDKGRELREISDEEEMKDVVEMKVVMDWEQLRGVEGRYI
jgi:hypothetical protein